MEKDRIGAEDISFLKQLIERTEIHIQPYRKILILWSGIIFVSGIVSQFFIYAQLVRFISLVWIVTVGTGIIISHLSAKKIREREKINPFLARLLATIWVGAIMVVFCFYAIAFISPEVSAQYISSFCFPVIALCTLVTTVLLKLKTGYIIAPLFLFCSLPAVLLPEYAMLLQAFVVGGGILVMGIKGNGQSESDKNR